LEFCRVIDPANTAVNVKYIVNVSAAVVVGASTYTIELNTDPLFVAEGIIQSSASPTMEFSLDPDTKYYSRVKTNLLPDDWGTIVKSFTTGNPVSLAYVVSPANNAVGLPRPVTVTANTVPGATTYTIEVNSSDVFSPLTAKVRSGASSQTFSGLAYATKYYVRVYTDLAPGSWGPVSSFKVKADPAARISTVDEGFAIEDETASADFEVIAFPNPFGEKLSVLVKSRINEPVNIEMISNDGRIIHRIESQTNKTIEISSPVPAGMYYLRAKTGTKTQFVKLAKTR
jgi:hypothetical protein